MVSGSATEARAEMVARQLRARGIRDERVLAAMRSLPREAFVPVGLADLAYDDAPLPIGEAQTISQPWMVARMLECLCLRGDERVLEVGAGSGYQAALLGMLAREVYAVERIAILAEQARVRLAAIGATNVIVGCFDGSQGWQEHAPYDAIVVAAAAPRVPSAMVSQLTMGGRMVAPIGDRNEQRLTLITRASDGVRTTEDVRCVFVPLVGQDGWDDPTALPS